MPLICLCVLAACGQVPVASARLLAHPSAARASVAASGCRHAPPIPVGTSAGESLPVGGLTRTYRLHIPADYAVGRPRPLVLLFHGHSSSALAFEHLTGFSHLADRDDFIAVYPQGWVGRDGLTGWNTARPRDPATDDLRFTRDLLDHLQAMLCVDPTRIYAAGFSNGGGFVAVLACQLAGRLAAVAPVAGEFYPQPGGCHPTRPLPVLEIHGTADRLVPYDGSQRLGYPPVTTWLAQWAARDVCAAGPTVFYQAGAVTGEAWGRCAAGASVLHYRVLGGTHTWPAPRIGRALTAPDAQLDASAVIWSFLAAHRLPRA